MRPRVWERLRVWKIPSFGKMRWFGHILYNDLH